MSAVPKRKRFGEIAIEKGFLTPELLEEALRLQNDPPTEDLRDKPIGQILMDQGRLTPAQVLEVLEEIVGD